ncbi:TPA: transcriptional regulator, partial [Candidatus Uhrbacteria bacterium]|nr:transcriptional regulator [Candidatus Uhrbacteria bacterium]
MDYVARELINVGFSDKEAAVYLAALQLGLSSIQDIAKKSGVNRATTYLLVDVLIKKGLMGVFVKDGRKFFAAESP